MAEEPNQSSPEPDVVQQPAEPEEPPRPAAKISPSFMPPPIAYTPAPNKKQGSSFGKGFGLGAGFSLGLIVGGIVLGTVGMLISVLALGAILSSAGEATPNSAIERVETVWGADSAEAKDTIRAISISGPIMAESDSSGFGLTTATSGYEVANLLDSLDKKDSKGVLLLMNTPGGTINGSKAIADAVVRYQKRTGQKVIAYVRGISASGGMYAMAGADEIISDNGTMIGSIGVIFGPLARYRDVTAIGSTVMSPGVTTTGGITQEYLYKGKGKDFGNPFRDMEKEERAVFMKGIENEYDIFVSWVSKARDIPTYKIRQDLGAYIFGPKQAKENGLIDSIMGPDEAFNHIAESMGIK
ncbi:MAG: signal peptide peptidase SppA, 36K type, partial [Actinomycetales bacterium]